MRVLGALVVAMALSAGQAGAGAWTLEPGAAFVSLSGSAFRPSRRDAADEVTSAVYAEIGVRRWLTVGGAVESKTRRDTLSTVQSYAAFVRARLREGAAGDPLSVQVGHIGPLGSDAPDLAAEERAIDLRLLYGRGFDSRLGPGWLNAEGGLRLLRGDGADEWRLDLTAGIRPTARTLAMLQAFGTLGRRNQRLFGSDYDELKLAPSVGVVFGRATVVLGTEHVVTGRNIDRGRRLRVSLWRSF